MDGLRSVMADHFRGATQMIAQTVYLCASCGCEVRMEWAAPAFGLCEACEEKAMAADTSWRPGQGEWHET